MLFSNSYLSCEICGRLGADPKSHQTRSGKAMTTISVAVKTLGRGEDGKNVESTQWTGVTFFGPRAETVQKLLKKGDLVRVTGTPAVRQFTRKNGETSAMLEVVAEDFQLLAGVPRDKQNAAAPAAPQQKAAAPSGARDAYESESRQYAAVDEADYF